VNKKLSVAIPTLVAIIGIAIVSRVAAVPSQESTEVVSAPTVYSQDHSRVQSRAGEAEPLPPQF
jgi:hypothetical protein